MKSRVVFLYSLSAVTGRSPATFQELNSILKLDDRSAHTYEITVGSVHHISRRRLDPC